MPCFDFLKPLLDSPGTWCILSFFGDILEPPHGSLVILFLVFVTYPRQARQPNWLKKSERQKKFKKQSANDEGWLPCMYEARFPTCPTYWPEVPSPCSPCDKMAEPAKRVFFSSLFSLGKLNFPHLTNFSTTQIVQNFSIWRTSYQQISPLFRRIVVITRIRIAI